MSAGPSGGKTGTRKVLITGGGSGIGLAVAEALVRAGGRVAVTGRRPGPLEQVAASFPGQAFALPCDVASASAREGLLARARDVLGGLDGFVHCAGWVRHQPFGHIDEDALRGQLEVNLVAPLRLGEQALDVLEPGGGMVFLSSTLAHRPLPTSAVYSAAKAGLLQVVKALALTGAARGIRANTVSPGVVDTAMTRELRLRPGEEPPPPPEHAARLQEQLEFLGSLHPLGRLGQPGELAEAVVHLLGASWTTGAEVVVDGGILLRE
ncbi:SDR family NAD(P)-dependent oxidoreductase [Stigmatella aurantiaca]|uniref:Oxidoreductase, short-chain dehydrogenase/reductase family n=1 Tax=Stigmatella aurantiaca (strain DW4/3-1) TaxID=378806 RepID=Q08RM5_STIAD|nr:SDR family oxidoreductase [Stigmatella aurantiaca]ADO68790.1 Oxidoreductase, short-chain dehydrogenase/reductase family [Stigmatella aurantiaca DW4/3-1]EAU63130.1 short chain dehydrogenase [Stigmatella aurantiaca DW4/3-1]